MLRKIVRIVEENWVFIVIALLVAVVLALTSRKEGYMQGCSTCTLQDAGVLPGSVFTMKQIMDLDKELEGCKLCSLGDAGVLPGSVFTMKQVMDLDKEIAGCGTCSPGDAGVLEDTETTPETEMYNMPDEYYGSDVKIAETNADVAFNPSVIAAVAEDREEDQQLLYMTPTEYRRKVEQEGELEYLSPMQRQDMMAQAVYNMTQDFSAFTDTEISSDLMSIDPIDYTLQNDAQLVNDFYGDSEIDYNKRKRLATIKKMPISFYKSDSSFTLLP
ncbi:hypothetical protein ATCVMN08101_828R [Acanthocystis turfacea Chlorella virus MN0810.1]|nr:hypothetical protein ATCVMN08101_828R [Acanthocystis turfacea Chlorella virus MN0810.1]